MNFGPDFPRGIFIAMNSAGKNFLVYDWRAIERIARDRRP